MNPQIYKSKKSSIGSLHNQLMRAQEHLERNELLKAQSIYERILRNNSGHLIARRNLGATLVEQDKLDQALSHYEIAIKYHPNDAELHYSLGVITQRFNKLWEALEHYLKAIELNPKHIEAFENLANIQTQLGLYDDALTSYQYILDIDPHRDSTMYSMSLILLLHGQFKKGWELYEHRWATPDFGSKRPDEVKRIWSHIEEINCKSVLVIHEQGYGDTIQFSRYAIILLKLGAKVTLVVQPELVDFIKTINSLFSLSKINVVSTEKISELETHDYCLPIMSLPNALNEIINGIPELSQYLWANEHKTRKWSDLLPKNNKPNIGIAWFGNTKHKNDQNRSIPWEVFKNIIDDNFNYHKLNLGIKPHECKSTSNFQNLYTWDDKLNSFEDTAALVHCMDLIITVDTSIAHIAGSLNKKTHLLIPSAPDFRWLLDKQSTPWYPSIKLFRSKQIGHWNELIEKYKNELNHAEFKL